MQDGPVVETRPHFKTSTISIIIPTGSADEPKAGVTSLLLEHMERSTASMDELGFADYLDDHGMTLRLSPGRTAAFFRLRYPAGMNEEAISIVKEVFFNQEFDENHHRIIVDQEIAYLHQIRSSPDRILKNYLRWDATYDDAPITKHPSGSEDSLPSITLNDIERRHQELLSHRATMVVTGPKFSKWDVEGFSDIISRFGEQGRKLGAATGSRSPLRSVERPPTMESSNVYIGVNLRTKPPVPESIDQLIFKMLVGGGLSTKLFKEIREVRNLSYAPQLLSASFPGGGFVTALMDLSPQNVEEAVRVTMDGLHSILFQTVPAKELRRAVKMALSSFSFYTDTSNYLADFIANRVSYGLSYDISEIKREISDTLSRDWQSGLQDLWIENNLSFCSTTENGYSNVWKEISEVYF